MTRKKFSLSDRVEYHKKTVRSWDGFGAKPNKVNYSEGYVDAVKSGKKASAHEHPSYNRGYDSGKKAKEKAATVKF